MLLGISNIVSVEWTDGIEAKYWTAQSIQCLSSRCAKLYLVVQLEHDTANRFPDFVSNDHCAAPPVMNYAGKNIHWAARGEEATNHFSL
jgi:hypothetical protein